MIDMDQKIEIEWNNANRKWFVDKGYVFTNWGDKFLVKAKDLRPRSGYKIKFICDYCGNEVKQSLGVYMIGHNKYPKDACSHCACKKSIEMRKDKIIDDMRKKVMKQATIKGYEIEFNWDDYKNQSTRINYICPEHGKHDMSCANFVRGYGCPECRNKSVADKNRLSKERVIEIIESINGNKLLNPDDYIGNRPINLLVRCCCGNTFYTSIAKYDKKFRCPKCVKSESFGENIIKTFLDNNKISYTHQYKYDDCKDVRPLPFDFHINNKQINIEFDGKQHFEPIYGEEQLRYIQRHDHIKTEYCKNNNIKLIRINYLQRDDIDEILTKELLAT